MTEKVYNKKTLKDYQDLYGDSTSLLDLYHGYHYYAQYVEYKRKRYHKNKQALIDKIEEVKAEIKASPPPPLPPPTESGNPEPPKPKIIQNTKLKKLT